MNRHTSDLRKIKEEISKLNYAKKCVLDNVTYCALKLLEDEGIDAFLENKECIRFRNKEDFDKIADSDFFNKEIGDDGVIHMKSCAWSMTIYFDCDFNDF